MLSNNDFQGRDAATRRYYKNKLNTLHSLTTDLKSGVSMMPRMWQLICGIMTRGSSFLITAIWLIDNSNTRLRGSAQLDINYSFTQYALSSSTSHSYQLCVLWHRPHVVEFIRTNQVRVIRAPFVSNLTSSTVTVLMA